MGEIQLSVIVPVFNAEVYLERCLRSICANDGILDAEFIIVDDGSTDKSAEIIDEYAARDSRIKPIHIKNSGVANARNIGICNSSARYITFLDADDYFAESTAWANIAYIVGMLDETGCDLAVSSYFMISNNSCSEIDTGLRENSQKDDIVIHALTTSKLNAAWSKIYRRTLITENNIIFPCGVPIGEDYSFVLDCLQASNTMLSLKKPFLCYVVNSDSVMHSSSITKSLKGIEVCKNKALEYALANSLDKLIPQINNFYFRAITALLNSCSVKQDCFKLFEEILENDLCKEILSCVEARSLSLRRRVELFLIKKTKKTRVYYFKMRSMIQKRRKSN